MERSTQALRSWKEIIADPEMKAAVRDIDQSLLDWALSLTPMERLRCASNAAIALNKFKHVKTESS